MQQEVWADYRIGGLMRATVYRYDNRRFQLAITKAHPKGARTTHSFFKTATGAIRNLRRHLAGFTPEQRMALEWRCITTNSWHASSGQL